jgi:hypothetical protein
MDYDCLVPDIATGPFLAHQVSCFLALKACIKITALKPAACMLSTKPSYQEISNGCTLIFD